MRKGRRYEQLARARAARTKIGLPKEPRPCVAASAETTIAFSWTEAARLELVKGVKLMENNLTICGQIKSWRAIARALPQQLFERADMNRLANIAQKQFSDMRRKYRIMKEKQDSGRMPKSSMFKCMTKKIMEELDDYEAVRRHRELRPPRPRLSRGPRKPTSQQPTAKGTGRTKEIKYYEIEVTLQPGLEDCMSGYDLNVPVEFLPSPSESKEINDDNDDDKGSSASDLYPVHEGGESKYINTVEADVTGNDSNDDEPAELLAKGEGSDDDEPAEQLGERPAENNVERHTGCGDSPATAANIYTDLEVAMKYFTDGGGERKEVSLSGIDRLQREVESAAAGTVSIDSEENRERASEESLRLQRRRKIRSSDDDQSDPEWVPENSGGRNQIEKRLLTSRQRPGPSAAAFGGGHLVNENDDKRNGCNVVRQRRRPKEIRYDRQMRVVTSESDPERELNPAAASRRHPGEGFHGATLNLIRADQSPPAAGNGHGLGFEQDSRYQRGHRSSSVDGVSQQNPQGVNNKPAAACNEEEDEVHETDEAVDQPASNESDSQVNDTNIRTAESDSEEQINKGTDQELQIHHGQTAAGARPTSSSAEPDEVIFIGDSQSDPPENNDTQRNEEESLPQQYNANYDHELTPHELDGGDSQAAAYPEFVNEERIRFSNYNPIGREGNPVDSNAEDDRHELYCSGHPDRPRRQSEILQRKNGSEADSEFEDEGGRSRALKRATRNPGIRSRDHHHGVHSRSRKRARKGDVDEIRSGTTKGRLDSGSSESEQHHHHHEHGKIKGVAKEDSPFAERKLQKALKKVDAEFSRLNWWTKHRLFPTGREMISRVIKSTNIHRTLRLRREGTAAHAAPGGGAEFGELIGKCRRKQMGWVIKAEFQQIRLKLADEMQKTTHIVVQEVIQSTLQTTT